MNDDAPAAKKRVTTDGEQSTLHTRERRVDSQLIFSTKNAHRLYVCRPHHILEMVAANWRWLIPSV